MKQVQINRLEMFQDTNSYMDAQISIWSSIPIVGNYKTLLAEIIDKIKAAALLQNAAQVFIGKSLRQIKKDVSQKMDILDDNLEAYALDTDNPELLHQASNAASDYFKLANEDFEIKTINMLNLLTSQLENLAPYGVTAAQIEDAMQSFNEFSDKRGKPRAFQIASRVATQDIESLMSEGSNTLTRMDNVLKRFKRSNPSFYNGYLAARHIVND